MRDTHTHHPFWPIAAALLCGIAGCKTERPEAAPTPAKPAPAAVDPMTAVNTLIPAPPDYAARQIDAGRYPIPPYAKFLAGVRICLNPGHGGDAHRRGFKRGPTGVREAEMNLRVAQYLREFLVRCGAEVRLTREDDIELSYEQRAEIANRWPADLFVSIHHNAIDNRPQANYTTVWYHDGVDARPSNLDLARYLCGGLYDTLALPQITDVPLKSDLLMYERGFAVLRHARVTAALTESAFYTNPEQEQKLRSPAYNLLEAYGLLLGLARYAAAGLPRARLLEPLPAGSRPTATATSQPVGLPLMHDLTVRLPRGARRLVFELDDGLRSRKSWGWQRTMILRDSVAARLDGSPLRTRFSDDGQRYRLVVDLPRRLRPGRHTLRLHFENLFKNSVIHPEFQVVVR